MDLFDVDTPPRTARAHASVDAIDSALAAQIIVAWAGEAGDEEKRLGWWRTDLISEFGGMDLFRRLLPATAEWAVLQAAREAARRADAELRRQGHDADRIVTLFSLGFELDERIDERLQDLKRSGRSPHEALRGLAESVTTTWNRDRFADWVAGHGQAETAATPIGRHLKGELPPDLEQVVDRLVAALSPLSESYPLPHFRRAA
jgi:hypothetical protein